jgi:DNA-directed RNA polymerase specialized sigma24 family protein
VELRLFSELSAEGSGEVLKVSQETVHRDWKRAKAWLAREMGNAEPSEPAKSANDE